MQFLHPTSLYMNQYKIFIRCQPPNQSPDSTNEHHQPYYVRLLAHVGVKKREIVNSRTAFAPLSQNRIIHIFSFLI